MLYSLLSVVIRIALKIFFQRIEVRGKENIPVKGPIIIIGNHPNTFMDPILAALVVLPRQVHFLANGSIFKTKLARLVLAQLNTIPVYRKQDETDNRSVRNEAAFHTCYDFLGSGGLLLIFPEGNSINERKLRPLKTGTARIALGAEDRHNFQLPLTILPIGLNYTNPTRFRERVLITIGKPFAIKDYQKLYQADANEAVLQLTNDIQKRMEELIIVTSDEEEDDLVRKLETVYRGQLSTDIKKRIDLDLTKKIVQTISSLREYDPVFVRNLKEKVDSYFDAIREFKVNDYLVEQSRVVRYSKLVRYILYFVAGFPLYLAGLLFNYIPYFFPSRIANWISEDEEYRAPIMMSAGIFTFPTYYAMILYLIFQLVQQPLLIIVIALWMPLSGFFVLQYYKRLRNLKSSLAFYRIAKYNNTAIDWLKEQRDQIIRMLEGAQNRVQKS